jgi:cell division protein FtsA
MGVAVVDIGGGTTDIGIFIDNSVCHTVVLPTGGNHLTNDIAVGLHAPFASAEQIKLAHGHAVPEDLDEEHVEVVPFGAETRHSVSRRFLAQIIRARMEEIFDLVQQEIKRSGYSDLLPAGLVLCGGTAGLRGIEDLGRRELRLPIRVGRPHDLRGLVDNVLEPAYAASVGLLQWTISQPELEVAEVEENTPWDRVTRWLHAFLPG